MSNEDKRECSLTSNAVFKVASPLELLKVVLIGYTCPPLQKVYDNCLSVLSLDFFPEEPLNQSLFQFLIRFKLLETILNS